MSQTNPRSPSPATKASRRMVFSGAFCRRSGSETSYRGPRTAPTGAINQGRAVTADTYGSTTLLEWLASPTGFEPVQASAPDVLLRDNYRSLNCPSLLPLLRSCGLVLRASGAAEFHHRALSEPDVSLSAHPAPGIRLFAYRSGQCAKSSGLLWTIRANHSRALFGFCLKRLNLRRAHFLRWKSIRRRLSCIADL
jgi:hypothetical protein